MSAIRQYPVLCPCALAVSLAVSAVAGAQPVVLWREGGSDSAVSLEQPAPAGAVSVLVAPADGAVRASTAADAEGAPVNFAALAAGTGATAWRAGGKHAITSGYGYRRHPLTGQVRAHAGVDLAARIGTAILASSAGRVRHAGWRGGYGLLVEVEHAGGLTTRYAHLSRIAVVPGQAIAKGTLIGLVGSTGQSTGPHLHYEVRLRGEAVNPLPPSGK